VLRQRILADILSRRAWHMTIKPYRLPGADLDSYLLQSPQSHQVIKATIRDGIARARAHGDYRHSAKLKLLLFRIIEHCHDAPREG
jgi:hypothetical protein